MAKNIKSVGVLVAICAVVALLLALVNQITAPIIEENERIKAAKALQEVLPGSKTFEQVDLSEYEGKLPASVIEVHKADGDKGYVIKLAVKGYKPDLTIMCGVTPDGIVKGAKCVSSGETNGAEKDYGKNFVGKDAAGVNAVDTISGSTMTTSAYKQAIKDALNTVSALKGEVVDLRTDEEKAVDQLKEDLGATEEVDLSEHTLPDSVTKVMKGDKGYVVYLTVKGWEEGMEIVCGVSTDNKIVGAVCLKSNETKVEEKTYGENFVGKDLAGVEAVDTIAGVTETTKAYKQAVKDALNVAAIVSGGSADLRTEEEKFNDNLKAALPAADAFVKQAIADGNHAIDFIYAATNNAGYVYVIDGTTFVGVDAQGNITTEGVDADTAELVKDKALLAASHVAIDTTDTGINQNVTSVQKTIAGNYVIEVNGLGFAYFGGEHVPGRNIPIKICTVISPEGVMLECLTVSQEESKDYGAVCGEESYYGQFDGKTIDNYKEVDIVGSPTYRVTNDGYLKAIERCFKAVEILEGGAEE